MQLLAPAKRPAGTLFVLTAASHTAYCMQAQLSSRNVIKDGHPIHCPYEKRGFTVTVTAACRTRMHLLDQHCQLQHLTEQVRSAPRRAAVRLAKGTPRRKPTTPKCMQPTVGMTQRPGWPEIQLACAGMDDGASSCFGPMRHCMQVLESRCISTLKVEHVSIRYMQKTAGMP